MDDFDDIPPLEDMSEMVDKVRNIKFNNHEKLHQASPEQSATITEIKEDVKPAKPKQKKDFGGFKKGFLFGSAPPVKKNTNKGVKKTVKAVEKDTKVDFVINTNKNSAKSSLVFDDVQKEMEKTKQQMKPPDWLNDDIIKNIESDKDLLSKLAQPKYAAAVELMKTDPKAALEKYKDDKEVAEFFKKFYGILGSHFTNLANSSGDTGTRNQPIYTRPPAEEPHIMSEEDRQVQDVLKNPELREILQKGEIKRLMKLIREDPNQAQHMLMTGSHEFKRDVQTLISNGLLKIA